MQSLTVPTAQDIDEALVAAIKLVQNEKPNLFRYGVHERAVAHRIGLHMHSLEKEFSIHVDCEYNRVLETFDPKRRVKKRKGKKKETLIYPDLIVHVRQKKINLLVVEIKLRQLFFREVSMRANELEDIEKLKGLVSNEYSVNYERGVFLVFEVGTGNLLHADSFTVGGIESNSLAKYELNCQPPTITREMVLQLKSSQRRKLKIHDRT